VGARERKVEGRRMEVRPSDWVARWEMVLISAWVGDDILCDYLSLI
jgi:hypothetical protein